LRARERARGTECGCRLAAVRRDLELALRVLAETEMRLPLDEELVNAHLTATEAERLDRYCLNLKVSLDELQRWSRLLAGNAEALAQRKPTTDA
jgi:hypothetical protein